MKNSEISCHISLYPMKMVDIFPFAFHLNNYSSRKNPLHSLISDSLMHAWFLFSVWVNVAWQLEAHRFISRTKIYFIAFSIFMFIVQFSFYLLTYVCVRIVSKQSRIPYPTYAFCLASKLVFYSFVDLPLTLQFVLISGKLFISFSLIRFFRVGQYMFSFLVGMQEWVNRIWFGWLLIWFHFVYFEFSLFSQFLVSTFNSKFSITERSWKMTILSICVSKIFLIHDLFHFRSFPFVRQSLAHKISQLIVRFIMKHTLGTARQFQMVFIILLGCCSCCMPFIGL